MQTQTFAGPAASGFLFLSAVFPSALQFLLPDPVARVMMMMMMMMMMFVMMFILMMIMTCHTLILAPRCSHFDITPAASCSPEKAREYHGQKMHRVVVEAPHQLSNIFF
jgi:hypothetical protein